MPGFIFGLNIFYSVHGNWGEWSEFDDCSAECGDGIQTRTRTCSNPVPQYGGTSCEGDANQEQVCKLKDCPGMHIIKPI